MKLPLSWINEFINTSLTPQEIDNLLTMAGLEVDALIPDEEETLFEISLTPNLGHCQSVLGVARELSASTKKPFTIPAFKLEENEKPIEDLLNVVVENEEACWRYGCRFISDITVGPSPEWLRKRVEACGIRSINNIVDITNFVMMEYGHPLHAFDADKFSSPKIVVRNAKEGEKFQTLDEKEHTLTPDTLLICDNEKPVALAGVMGGLSTEVSETTKNVILESALFHPGVVRRMSKTLAISTESSRRFERGCDPDNIPRSLDRAASLMHDLAKGKVHKGKIDIKKEEFEKKTITCRYSRINKLLGTMLALSEVESIFDSLEFIIVKCDNQELFTLEIPTYRNDLFSEIDIIEEVARIYGYDNIKTTSTKYISSSLPHAPIYLFENEVRNNLLAEGLQEFLTCDLISPSLSNLITENPIPKESIVKVVNPTSIEQSILRASLLPGLLQLVKNNQDHQNRDLNGFEIGRIHFKTDDQYKEQTMVGIILTGHHTPHHWDKKPDAIDFYHLKGTLENCLEGLNIEKVKFSSSKESNFHPGRQASIHIGEMMVGVLGEIHPSTLKKLDISQPLYFAEINLHDLFGARSDHKNIKPLSPYPSSERDWTIPMREDSSLDDLMKTIDLPSSKLLKEVILRDIYRDPQLENNIKNVTLRFIYRDDEKTVEQEAVDQEHEKIVKKVLADLGDQILEEASV